VCCARAKQNDCLAAAPTIRRRVIAAFGTSDELPMKKYEKIRSMTEITDVSKPVPHYDRVKNTRRLTMKTMLLTAAAALMLTSGIALADSGDSFDFNKLIDAPAGAVRLMPQAQSGMIAPANAPHVVIGHSTSQSQDTSTGSLDSAINWGSG
jgi:hypothetical protein